MASVANSAPQNLFINRDPLWVNIPREVGDGMEAKPDESMSVTTINSLETTISRSSAPLSTVTSSSTETIFKSYYHVEESHASSFRADISSFPSSSTQSTISFANSEKNLIEEKSALKDHLQVQIQVNQEIKKLLVASVGDDLGYHYERLSTEKAQLAKEIEDLSHKLSLKTEEMERLEISCDIWRSKFLASRLQCDDMLKWKNTHERQMRELDSGARGLLREHWQRSEHLECIYKLLLHLDQSLNDGRLAADMKFDPTSCLAGKSRTLMNGLSQTLLDTQPPPPKQAADSIPKSTPAEKHLVKVLGNIQRSNSSSDNENNGKTSSELSMSRGVISHLHSYIDTDNITVNCCARCTGDIIVV